MQPAGQLRRQGLRGVVEPDAPPAAGLRGPQEFEVDAPLSLLQTSTMGGAEAAATG